jgi:hypothetical protein
MENSWENLNPRKIDVIELARQLGPDRKLRKR